MLWSNATTVLIASGVMGLLSGYLAYRRERNPYLWFLIGFGLTMAGIVPIFFAPLLKKRKNRVATQLQPQPYLKGPKNKFWYFVDKSRTQQGPLSYDAIFRAWKEQTISLETLVWHEDLNDWKPLQKLIEIRMQTKRGS